MCDDFIVRREEEDYDSQDLTDDILRLVNSEIERAYLEGAKNGST
tara:strand:- start:389 stop:523 length:135 start_codon:yes stop_codon:yes gene_type:complete